MNPIFEGTPPRGACARKKPACTSRVARPSRIPIGLVACLTFAFPQRAAAQATDPGYHASPEVVVTPLLVQAEADAAAHHPALARARAALILRFAPSGSPTAARATRVYDAAGTALAANADAPPPPDVAVAPLLAQAEADETAGMHGIALARLHIVMQIAPASTPAALRAQQLYRTAYAGFQGEQGGAGASSAPPGAGAIAAAQAPTAYATAPGAVPATASSMPAAPNGATAAPPVDPNRRRAREMVELYAFGASFGLFSGMYVAEISGANSADTFSLAASLGGMAGAVSVLALDVGLGGLRTGQPLAISGGLTVGLTDGLLAWGAFPNDLPGNDSLNVVWLSTLAGGVLGGLGAALEPTRGQARFVLSGAMWGGWLMTIAALLAAPSNAEDGYRMVLAGFNVGLVASAVLATQIPLSEGRVMGLDGGLLIGAAGGAMLPGFIALARNDAGSVSGRTVAVSMGVGSIAGFTIALLIQESHRHAAATPTGARADATDVRFFAAPTTGGATAGMAGVF